MKTRKSITYTNLEVIERLISAHGCYSLAYLKNGHLTAMLNDGTQIEITEWQREMYFVK